MGADYLRKVELRRMKDEEARTLESPKDSFILIAKVLEQNGININDYVAPDVIANMNDISSSIYQAVKKIADEASQEVSLPSRASASGESGEVRSPGRRQFLKWASAIGAAATLSKIGIPVEGKIIPAAEPSNFITVKGTHLIKDGRPFYFMGINYWSVLPLAQRGEMDKVRQELDKLQETGVNVLRIMASGEGPNDEPWRFVPTIQPAEGILDEKGIKALKEVMGELEKRNVSAIMCLNNFWPWSGG